MVKRSETIESVLAELAFLMGRMRSEGTNQSAWLTLDLSMSQMKTLMIILNGGEVTAGAIAQHLGVNPSAVTPVVDKLVENKLAKREPAAHDRRVTLLVPTAKATALREKLLAAGRAFWVPLLEDLNDDELAAAQRAFAAITHALRKQRGLLQENKK